MGRKQEKAQQRKTYQDSFKGVKHGHGGRSIRKKDEAALGKQFGGSRQDYGPPITVRVIKYIADDQRVYSIYILWSFAFLR